MQGEANKQPQQKKISKSNNKYGTRQRAPIMWLEMDGWALFKLVCYEKDNAASQDEPKKIIIIESTTEIISAKNIYTEQTFSNSKRKKANRTSKIFNESNKRRSSQTIKLTRLQTSSPNSCFLWEKSSKIRYLIERRRDIIGIGIHSPKLNPNRSFK